MKQAAIVAIEYHLPAETVSTERLASEFPEWSVTKIDQKTGISERHIAAEEQCSSDLAVEAARKLFASGACQPKDVDYILFCTQSPDYFLPTTACTIQNRLGIPQSAGAIDFNLGCSGFVAGLGLAKGLIETGQATKVLLLTAETYSKFLNRRDKSVRTIFGDAGAATLVGGVEPAPEPYIGPLVYGTDGSGAENLIVRTGGMREPRTSESAIEREEESGNFRSRDNLFMNGAEIFSFTLRVIPKCVEDLLTQAHIAMDAVDVFVFHQANRFMLEHLRKQLKIPEGKFQISMQACGNTVSSTIPIALRDAYGTGKIKSGDRAMLVGFGVGYSWASALIRWL
jgi:3-oxoacyl-[acyl-carrier-protein] synthase-3